MRWHIQCPTATSCARIRHLAHLDLSTPSTIFPGKDMFPLYDPCGKTSTFRTTRRSRRWICLLTSVLLSGILFLHPLAPDPDKWREAAIGPFWPSRRPSIWDGRAQRVKDAFIDAYGHYQKYAFGADELSPLSNQPRNKYAQITPYLLK